MGLFNRKEKLYIPYAKEKILGKIKNTEYKIIGDLEDRFIAAAYIKGRPIEIRLNRFSKNAITIDIVDPFGIIRIPRKTLKYKDDFDLFMMTNFSKLIEEIVK